MKVVTLHLMLTALKGTLPIVQQSKVVYQRDWGREHQGACQNGTLENPAEHAWKNNHPIKWELRDFRSRTRSQYAWRLLKEVVHGQIMIPAVEHFNTDAAWSGPSWQLDNKP